MTGDESLSCELFFSAAGDFLSLLYSGHGDLQQEDPAVQSRKQDPPAVHESQIGCYNWLCEAVERYLSEERPDKQRPA